jgi:hypothetical protein
MVQKDARVGHRPCGKETCQVQSTGAGLSCADLSASDRFLRVRVRHQDQLYFQDRRGYPYSRLYARALDHICQRCVL